MLNVAAYGAKFLKKSNYEKNYGKVQSMPPSQYLVFSIENGYIFYSL
jgi:hypothetical protein